MDLEQLESLIDEYIAQVPDDDGDEWYGPYRDFARSVLKRNEDEPPYEAMLRDTIGLVGALAGARLAIAVTPPKAFEPFLVWLKRRMRE